MNKIDKLIINSPYEEPKQYWFYDNKSQKFSRENGRRPAGYVIASESAPHKPPRAGGSGTSMGKFVEIPLVNEIRPIIKAWKENGYSGISSY